jgi:hypothetical protein
MMQHLKSTYMYRKTSTPILIIQKQCVRTDAPQFSRVSYPPNQVEGSGATSLSVTFSVERAIKFAERGQLFGTA